MVKILHYYISKEQCFMSEQEFTAAGGLSTRRKRIMVYFIEATRNLIQTEVQ